MLTNAELLAAAKNVVPRFLSDRWEHLRRAKDYTPVATHSYRSFCAFTGNESLHIATFWVDGNGERFSTIETNCGCDAKESRAMREHRSAWRVRGDLPEDAQRVRDAGPGYHTANVVPFRSRRVID